MDVVARAVASPGAVTSARLLVLVKWRAHAGTAICQQPVAEEVVDRSREGGERTE